MPQSAWGNAQLLPPKSGMKPEVIDFWDLTRFLHWSWCIPTGVLVAAGLIVKDRWYRPVVAGRINLVVFSEGLLIWGACMSVVIAFPFVQFPHVITR